MRYFKTSFVILFLGVFLIAAVTQDIELIGVSLLLILLEVSLSFDNAVVNAKVLSHMSPLWQRRFLVWGILIAVFGMRLLFPVAMVAWTSDYSMLEVTRLALYEPQLYGEALNEGLPIISAFGGAFLLMVCVEFFCNASRTVYWIKPFEKLCQALTALPKFLWILMILLSVLFCGMYDDSVLRIAFMLGLFTQYALHSLSSHLMSGMAGGKSSHAAGWVGFCYLEVLDASFSFDGVVGAFALTDHLLVIMVGLGIGAFFVRSLTIYLVDHQSITHLRYLDHGAHYAILSLAIVMMIKITGHLPEWLVGSISAIFIVASIGHSLLEKRVTRKKMKKLS